MHQFPTQTIKQSIKLNTSSRNTSFKDLVKADSSRDTAREEENAELQLRIRRQHKNSLVPRTSFARLGSAEVVEDTKSQKASAQHAA